MKEKEFKPLLNRERHKKDARKIFFKQIEVLVDLANYGSNLIVRAFDSSNKRLEDVIVICVLLKQVVSMLDAVEVLISHGIVNPVSLQVRCAFEASLYIDFILAGDSDQKARYYYVANLRNKRLWESRYIQGSGERKAFSHVFEYLEGYMAPENPQLVDEIKKDIEDIKRVLKQDNFMVINETFEKMRIKKTGEEAFWYKAYGIKSLRQIAEMVSRLAEYEIFYPSGSEVTHSTSYRGHIRFHEGMITFEPIRKLEGADSVLQNIMGIALSSYKAILKHYRYGELSHFKRKYIQDWRDGFQNITHVSYKTENTK
jgi:hypothetical protein